MGRKKIDQLQTTKTKFIMKGNPNGHFKTNTVIQFAVSKKNNLYKKISDSPIHPIFNQDCKYYTPAFILLHTQSPSQQDYYKNHIRKVEQSLFEIDQTQILIPKPRSKNKYCGVCRDNYEDYLQHIPQPGHQIRLERNTFHQHILNLCEYYKNKYLNINIETEKIERNISIETKLNEDENSTESIIEQQKCHKQNELTCTSFKLIN